jgi:hypothetical protein
MLGGGRGRSNTLHGGRGRHNDLVCNDRIAGGGVRNPYFCAHITGCSTHTSGRGSLFVFPVLGGFDRVRSGEGTPNSGPLVEQQVSEQFATPLSQHEDVCTCWFAFHGWCVSFG